MLGKFAGPLMKVVVPSGKNILASLATMASATMASKKNASKE